jgi:hypothetical protein
MTAAAQRPLLLATSPGVRSALLEAPDWNFAGRQPGPLILTLRSSVTDGQRSQKLRENPIHCLFGQVMVISGSDCVDPGDG